MKTTMILTALLILGTLAIVAPSASATSCKTIDMNGKLGIEAKVVVCDDGSAGCYFTSPVRGWCEVNPQL